MRDAMEPATVATIGAIAKAASKALEAINSARKKASTDPETEEALDQAHELVISLRQSILGLQDDVLRLQGDVLRLQEENGSLREQASELREKIREKETRTLDREQYERRKVGGATVVVPKDDPETFLCATCFEAEKKVYLNKLSPTFQSFGTHRCPKCDSVVSAR